jgi:hypothetical protein
MLSQTSDSMQIQTALPKRKFDDIDIDDPTNTAEQSLHQRQKSDNFHQVTSKETTGRSAAYQADAQGLAASGSSELQTSAAVLNDTSHLAAKSTSGSGPVAVDQKASSDDGSMSQERVAAAADRIAQVVPDGPDELSEAARFTDVGSMRLKAVLPVQTFAVPKDLYVPWRKPTGTHAFSKFTTLILPISLKRPLCITLPANIKG